MGTSILESTCFLDWVWMKSFWQGFCQALAKYDSARPAQGKDRCYLLCTKTSWIHQSDVAHALTRPPKQGGEPSCRVSLPLLMTAWNHWAKQWWEWRGWAGTGVPGGGGQMAHKPSLGRQEAGRLTDYMSRGSKPSSHAPMSQGTSGTSHTFKDNIIDTSESAQAQGMRLYQGHSSVKLALITYIITYDATQKLSRRLKTA